ncbi:MAG: hypothetical protein PHF57_12970 [Methanoregula sp.]|jgi:diphthamide biosynthesis methyltransferase|nr:hypothetical protein [Methanoregula sp.]
MDLTKAMNTFSKRVSLYKEVGGETFTEYHNREMIPGSFFAAIDENGKACLHTFFGNWLNYRSREFLQHEEFGYFSI